MGYATILQTLSLVTLRNFVKVYPKYFRGQSKLTRATLENEKTLVSWITVRYPIILEIISEYSTFQSSIEKKFSRVRTNEEFLKTYSFCKLHYKSDAALASETDSTEIELEEVTTSLENIFNGLTPDVVTTERRSEFHY